MDKMNKIFISGLALAFPYSLFCVPDDLSKPEANPVASSLANTTTDRNSSVPNPMAETNLTNQAEKESSVKDNKDSKLELSKNTTEGENKETSSGKNQEKTLEQIKEETKELKKKNDDLQLKIEEKEKEIRKSVSSLINEVANENKAILISKIDNMLQEALDDAATEIADKLKEEQRVEIIDLKEASFNSLQRRLLRAIKQKITEKEENLSKVLEKL